MPPRSTGRSGGRGTELMVTSAAVGELMDLARSLASVFKGASQSSGVRAIFSVLNHMEQIPKPEVGWICPSGRTGSAFTSCKSTGASIPWRRRPSAACMSCCGIGSPVTAQGNSGASSTRWPKIGPSHRDSAHHIGTTRMHQSPERGVTDPHCRVHGAKNLYVGGSSVLPTSGYANPTLTVIALAIRLAEHLKSLYRLNGA